MVLTTHGRLQLSSRVGLCMGWVRWWRGRVGSGPLHGLLEQWNATGGDKILGCRSLPLVMGFVKTWVFFISARAVAIFDSL
jgi:hypothetical protein